MKYFTSDWHIDDVEILSKAKRPFHDINEMNNIIISNAKNIIREEDTIYFIGDIITAENKEHGIELLNSIKCKKILIRGNNDGKKSYYCNVYDDVTKYDDFKLSDNTRIVMSHYPMLDWRSRDRNSIMLHGHMHNGPEYNHLNKKLGIRRFDIGVDANNFNLVSLDEIIEWFDGVQNRVYKFQNYYTFLNQAILQYLNK